MKSSQTEITTPPSLTERARQLVNAWACDWNIRNELAKGHLVEAVASFAAEAATATIAKYFCDEHQKLLSESQVEKFVCFWCAQNKIAEREVEAATAALEQAVQVAEDYFTLKGNVWVEKYGNVKLEDAIRAIAAIGDDRR